MAVALTFLAGCSRGGGEDLAANTTSTTSPQTTGPAPAGGDVTTGVAPTPDPPRLRAEPVADVPGALAMAVRQGDDALYVAQKSGAVKVVSPAGRVDPVPAVDLTEEVSTGGEQGLLGITFDPAGQRLYANFTDTGGDTRIVEWQMEGRRVRDSSRRQLLFVEQPFPNHNGGQLAFGPDGFLYIALGDGGSGGDPHDNGQRLNTLLGKILRIDPRADGDRPYRIPPDNPFAARPGARGEIWAYGLRNPWRFSFDPDGRLWIADVGQNTVEEVNVSPAGSKGGENYGWNRREGLRPFQGGDRPSGAIDPVHEYPTQEGCAVTGGYVYRGPSMPDLRGTYVFADFCNGQVKGLVGPERRLVDLRLEVPTLASFGEAADGELYALSLKRGVLRLTAA